MSTPDSTPLDVSERVLGLLRPSIVYGSSPADEAFIQLRDRGLAYNDKVLTAMPDAEWEKRGDELLRQYAEPEPPQTLEAFLRLPGITSLVAFVHGHQKQNKDRTCAVVATGHGVGRILISAGLRPDVDQISEQGRLRKAGVRWMPATALVDELADQDELWMPCPSCEDIALGATGGLVKRESGLALESSNRRVVLVTGELSR